MHKLLPKIPKSNRKYIRTIFHDNGYDSDRDDSGIENEISSRRSRIINQTSRSLNHTSTDF